MGDYLNCDPSTISNWERQKGTPNKERLILISRLHNTIGILRDELSFEPSEVAKFIRDEHIDRDTYQPAIMLDHVKDGSTSFVIQRAIESCIVSSGTAT
ncbi:MAG TPA: helix-turn-helix transcriptional regulator [Candidatus Saccharimonadales bacterium]|nr:helix-turn-helix transcriptional regulator [Candidatus Saccharimonadales bacterium]